MAVALTYVYKGSVKICRDGFLSPDKVAGSPFQRPLIGGNHLQTDP